MKTYTTSLAFSVLLATLPAYSADTTSTVTKSGKSAKGKVSLGKLIGSLDKAVSYSSKAAKETIAEKKKTAEAAKPAAADSKEPAKPAEKKGAHEGEAVLLSLKQLNGAVDKLQKTAEAKDKELFAAIDSTGKELAELKVAIRYTGIDDKEVKEGVAVLDDALDVIRENYSKPAIRQAKGGELSDEEKTKFQELKDRQKKLEAALTELQPVVKDNKRLQGELKHMAERLQKNTKKKVTVDSYTDLLLLMEEINQEWDALTWYVEKTKPTWAAEWTRTTVLFTEFETWYVSVEATVEVASVEEVVSEEAELEESDDIEVSMSDEEESEADADLSDDDVSEDDAGDEMDEDEEEDEDEDEDSEDDDEEEEDDDEEEDEE